MTRCWNMAFQEDEGHFTWIKYMAITTMENTNNNFKNTEEVNV